MSACVGVDVGGTFTDVVLGDAAGGLHVHKVLTTPDDPLRGVRRGVETLLQRTGTSPGEVARLVHGTTLATNVILERRGARVAFLTTAGFGDMLRLGREARVEGDRYDLHFEKPAPLVARELTFEVDERIGAGGTIVHPLDPAEAATVAARVRDAAPDAIAVCLLNAHTNPIHERALAAACRAALPDRFVAVSSEVWPEHREYDRAVTTVLSAAVGPVMAAYLAGLEVALAEIGVRCPVEVMESSGGVLRAARAARRPLATVESGGAAGVMAAGYIGAAGGLGDVVSFDMGGTTAKVGVVRDGRPDITHDFQVGGKGSFGTLRPGTGLPVKLPVVDLAEVGAGGGSIAWIDPTGALRVGPRSAGADPGPACYGRGGDAPTVTDANLVLGYLGTERLADGLSLAPSAAAAAIERDIARPLGLDVVGAAWAIHDLVNDAMAAAVHLVTVRRGIDPRPLALVALGGAGPLHAARLASRFGIRSTTVPWMAGVASAVGLCAADPTVHGVRPLAPPVVLRADGPPPAGAAATIGAGFAALAHAGRAELDGEAGGDPGPEAGGIGGRWAVVRALDVRYLGQAHQLTIDLDTHLDGVGDGIGDFAGDRDGEGERFDDDALALAAKAFRTRYRQLYGIEPAGDLEVVNLRTTVTRLVGKIGLPSFGAHVASTAVPHGVRPAHFGPDGPVATGVHRWDALVPGVTVTGPALVEAAETTVLVPPGQQARVDRYRNLIVSTP